MTGVGLVCGEVGGLPGAAIGTGLATGIWESAAGGDAKSAVTHGIVTGATVLVVGKAFEAVGGAIASALSRRAIAQPAADVAGAFSKDAAAGRSYFMAPSSAATDAAEAASEKIALYRGIAKSEYPQYEAALKGDAIPRGGDATPEVHSGGDTRSEYTSWSHNRKIAEWASRREGGIV